MKNPGLERMRTAPFYCIGGERPMNWQKEAINDLRSYKGRKQALDNMALRR